MKHTYTCPCGYKNSNKTHIHRHCNSTSCEYTVADIQKTTAVIDTTTDNSDISRNILTVLQNILQKLSSIETFLGDSSSTDTVIPVPPPIQHDLPISPKPLKIPKIPDNVWLNIHEAPARFSKIVGIKEDISDNIHTFLQYCEKSKKKVENCVGMLIHRVYVGDEKIRFIVLEDFINKHKIYKKMYPMITFYRDQQLTKDRIVGAFKGERILENT